MALLELSQLPLRVPVLAPLARCKNVLVFHLGETLGRNTGAHFSQPDVAHIMEVLNRYKLVPPTDKFAHLDAVRIKCSIFVIDPFEDTAEDIYFA